jgi:anti-anti-sigma factor
MLADYKRQAVEIEEVGDVAVFRLTRADLVDEALIQHLGHDLAHLIKERAYTKVVIDLGAVQRMSSAMFGQLLALWRQAKAANGRLVLCSTRPQVAEALTILRLTELILTYGNEQDALQSF